MEFSSTGLFAAAFVAVGALVPITNPPGNARFAARLVQQLSDTGKVVFLRLSTFILLCIGVQICWDGLAELLAPWKPR